MIFFSCRRALAVLRYGRIKDEHAWNGRPLYAREPEKACLHLPNPGVRNPRTRQNASGVWGAVRPRGAHSLWGSAKGRRCEPAQGRVSGPLRDHGAPVQRRAYPTAGQDRGHSSTAAPTSPQPADQNWQSQEDRSPANEKPAGLEPERKAAQIPLFFGSKKRFHSQFHLGENGFPSHAEWKQAWSEARSSQFFVLGSKDETAGCQGCVATRNRDGSYDLRVRLPNAAREKHLVIPGVRFRYGQEQLEECLAASRALSYRFLRDAKGWRIFVAMEGTPGKRISDRRLGAIGIDINLEQLVLAELDRFGNFIGGDCIRCVTYGKRRAQAKAILGDAVKQVMAAAIRARKPIVVECLEFAKKKSTLENAGRGRARLLSSFAYQQTLRYLKAAGFRAGVEVIPVDSAYTSTIGAVNYAARLGISIHQGAAIAIARRGLGLSERPAVRVAQLHTRRGGHVTLPLPARNRSKHVWSLWSEVSWRIRAALAAPVQLLPATRGSTPASLCLQTPCAT